MAAEHPPHLHLHQAASVEQLVSLHNSVIVSGKFNPRLQALLLINLCRRLNNPPLPALSTVDALLPHARESDASSSPPYFALFEAPSAPVLTFLGLFKWGPHDLTPMHLRLASSLRGSAASNASPSLPSGREGAVTIPTAPLPSTLAALVLSLDLWIYAVRRFFGDLLFRPLQTTLYEWRFWVMGNPLFFQDSFSYAWFERWNVALRAVGLHASSQLAIGAAPDITPILADHLLPGGAAFQAAILAEFHPALFRFPSPPPPPPTPPPRAVSTSSAPAAAAGGGQGGGGAGSGQGGGGGGSAPTSGGGAGMSAVVREAGFPGLCVSRWTTVGCKRGATCQFRGGPTSGPLPAAILAIPRANAFAQSMGGWRTTALDPNHA